MGRGGDIRLWGQTCEVANTGGIVALSLWVSWMRPQWRQPGPVPARSDWAQASEEVAKWVPALSTLQERPRGETTWPLPWCDLWLTSSLPFLTLNPSVTGQTLQLVTLRYTPAHVTLAHTYLLPHSHIHPPLPSRHFSSYHTLCPPYLNFCYATSLQFPILTDAPHPVPLPHHTTPHIPTHHLLCQLITRHPTTPSLCPTTPSLSVCTSVSDEAQPSVTSRRSNGGTSRRPPSPLLLYRARLMKRTVFYLGHNVKSRVSSFLWVWVHQYEK